MIRLDAATVLLQWSVGGLFFLWFTTRRREVGLGYGWLLRGTYVAMTLGGFAAAVAFGFVPVRDIAALVVAIVTVVVLATSVQRKAAGVSGAEADHDRRSARVAEMTGIDRSITATSITTTSITTSGITTSGITTSGVGTRRGREFPPSLDLIAPVVGVIGLIAAGIDASTGGAENLVVAILRTLAGAAFLGAVTDAMLLGHWYLVQPGLPRKHLNDIVRALGWVWPVEVASLLLPTGMLAVWTGEVDDGWNGTLGWFWGACAVTTIVLVYVTKAALKERYYSAVMAATGLLYLAILTAFGTDLVARAVLAG